MRRIKSLVFVSNYFNHHQKYLADAFYQRLGKGFSFVETIPMEEERKNLGWKAYSEPYLSKAYTSQATHDEALEKIREADVVIAGSADECFLQERIREKRIIFRYAERPFKGNLRALRFPVWYFKYNKRNPKNHPIYLLCASGYAYHDFRRMHLFSNRAYRWGYFPECVHYENIEELIRNKEENSILWCGRIINWKHLEGALYGLRKVLDQGEKAHLRIAGDGPLRSKMEELARSLHLTNSVEFMGMLPSDQVRKVMERSSLYLITSDFEEGWGAVLNESMNSGCAVVCSHAVGSAPFLIKDSNNGLLYKSGDTNELATCMMRLLQDNGFRQSLQRNAYLTITSEWSAEIAAERFLRLGEALINGLETHGLFDSGPCSDAIDLKNNWYSGKNNHE